MSPEIISKIKVDGLGQLGEKDENTNRDSGLEPREMHLQRKSAENIPGKSKLDRCLDARTQNMVKNRTVKNANTARCSN